MKKHLFSILKKSVLIVLVVFFNENVIAQDTQSPEYKNPFWNKVQFGGGLGLSIGGGYTDISVSPSAVYNINPYLGVGAGVQFSYVSAKNYYDSAIYGASVLTFIHPIPQIELSINLNQSRVNNNYEIINGANYSQDFWNTALFLGAGYRSGNITVGLTYNVLFDINDNVYGDAVTPFVRAYF